MNSELWADCPEIQSRIEKIQAETQRLQILLGVTPMTWEQRLEHGQQRRQQRELEEQERQRRQAELAKLGHRAGPRISLSKLNPR